MPGSQTERGLDPAGEAPRRAFARKLLRNRAPPRLDPLAFGCPRRVAGDLPLGLPRVGRIEVALRIGVNEPTRVAGRGQQPGLSSSVATGCISRWRARASRDMTVPMGTLVTSAISR